MITIRLEPCCKDCAFSNIDIDEHDLYADVGFYNKHVVIACKNELICKFRKESSGPIEPMKWGDDEHQGPKRLV